MLAGRRGRLAHCWTCKCRTLSLSLRVARRRHRAIGHMSTQAGQALWLQCLGRRRRRTRPSAVLRRYLRRLVALAALTVCVTDSDCIPASLARPPRRRPGRNKKSALHEVQSPKYHHMDVLRCPPAGGHSAGPRSQTRSRGPQRCLPSHGGRGAFLAHWTPVVPAAAPAAGLLQLSSPALSAQTAPRPKRLHGAGLAWPSISRRRKLPRWPTPRRE